MRRLVPGVAVACGLVMVLAAGCGAPGTGSGSDRAASGRVSADSCGRQVVFDSPPQRVLAIGSEAPSLLAAAGAGDKVTHYAGSLAVPFDAATKAVVERAERIAPDSHKVSFEAIINSGVDVAIGTDIGKGVDLNVLADRLAQAGVQLLTVSGYCAGIEGRSTGGASGFDLIYRDIETYGRLFGTEQAAAGAVKAMRDRVAAVTTRTEGRPARRGVPLYVTAEGPLGSYGGQSLVSEQMTMLGVDNVFGAVPKRYFEPTTEELVNGTPDVVMAMFLPTGSSALETEQSVVAELRSRPELAGLAVLANDAAVLPINYYYASPGPLAVDGLELLADRLAAP